MNKHNKLLCMVFFAMMVAVGVVISPILRVEGMCPMAHLINITMAVFMGPWYAFLCALAIGLIRMMTMGIPPLALTGAIFGATRMFYVPSFLMGTIIGGSIAFVVLTTMSRNGSLQMIQRKLGVNQIVETNH